MKKSMLCAAAVMLIAGAAVGMFARGYTPKTGLTGENFSILTPAEDEQELSLAESVVTIADDDVPLAAGPGIGTDLGIASEYTQPINQENPYIRQVIALVNEERAKAGLPPLEKSDDINLAAGLRAEEITSSFSHTRPDGSSYRTVLEQSGIAYRGCGENVAYGYSTPDAVMSAWMDSEGHRNNILNADYTNIGVGYVKDNGLGYWAQIFTVRR